MEWTPRRSRSTPSAGVPRAARSAMVFLMTRYLPPAARICLRSSKSWATVRWSKLARRIPLAAASSPCSHSTRACFSALVSGMATISGLSFGGGLDLRGVERHARAHGGGQGHRAQVLALGGGRLGAQHAGEQGAGILAQLVGGKRDLADRGVDQPLFVGAKLHLAGLDLRHRLGDLEGDGAGL